MASKRKNGEWRATYRMGTRQREITLPGKMSKECVHEFERLARVLAAKKYDGVRIERRDQSRIDDLPKGQRDRLVTHGLLEGKPDIPTLSGLIDYHKTLCSAKSTDSRLRDKRLYCYLLEFFPADKPIDTFVKTDAELFRNYLMVLRSVGKGLITLESASKFIRQLKSLFAVAVDADFLIKSPFASVKAGRTINEKRREYISGLKTQEAIDVMRELTLKMFLAFARFGGLRPCEVCHLRFSDFEFYESGFARFRIPKGKTGARFVPVSIALRLVVDALFSAASVKQERIISNQDFLVSEKYRKMTAGEIGVLIRKDMRKAKLPVWGKLFINLRSSFITDMQGRGLSVTQKDCIVGNSEQIRNDHYEQLNMSGEEYAELGERLLPKDWAEWGTGKTPIESPIVSHSDMAFWAKFDDSTPNMEIALTLCEANGLPVVESRKMLEKDGRVDVFGESVKSIRQSAYDYSQGKIPQTQLLFRAFGFLGRAAYEFIREIVITPSQLPQSNGARRTDFDDSIFLLFLVLRLPPFSFPIESPIFDRSKTFFDSCFTHSATPSTSPSAVRIFPYSIELEPLPIRSDSGGTDDSLTPNLERSPS